MSHSKSLIVVILAAVGFLVTQAANAHSLFRDPPISNPSPFVIKYANEGCWPGSAFFTLSEVGLSCRQLDPDGDPLPTHCEEGLDIKYEGEVVISKGNKNVNGTLSRTDGQGFQETQGNKIVGWPNPPFQFNIGGGKGKLDGSYLAIAYHPYVLEDGTVVEKATIEIAGSFGSGGTDTVAMYPSGVQLTIQKPDETTAESCARRFDVPTGLPSRNPPEDGIAEITGTFEGFIDCPVVNDQIQVENCGVQVDVEQEHGGTFSMTQNNFDACQTSPGTYEEDGTCKQVFGKPTVKLNKKFIRDNF
ncbi:MAG: hypothetical protein ACYSR5_09250, partial [Planctomycetota bacterium]